MNRMPAGDRLHKPGMGGGGASWLRSTGALGVRVSNSSLLMKFSFLKFSTSTGWGAEMCQELKGAWRE